MMRASEIVESTAATLERWLSCALGTFGVRLSSESVHGRKVVFYYDFSELQTNLDQDMFDRPTGAKRNKEEHESKYMA